MKEKNTIQQISLQNILSNNPNFCNFGVHIAMIRSVQNDLDRLLPERFRGKCTIIQVKGNKLILSVHSSAIATQLRLIQPNLIKQLQKSGGKTAQAITNIKVRMKPITKDLVRPEQKRQLSKEIKMMMANLADKVQDVKLRKSLQQIAQK